MSCSGPHATQYLANSISSLAFGATFSLEDKDGEAGNAESDTSVEQEQRSFEVAIKGSPVSSAVKTISVDHAAYPNDDSILLNEPSSMEIVETEGGIQGALHADSE